MDHRQDSVALLGSNGEPPPGMQILHVGLGRGLRGIGLYDSVGHGADPMVFPGSGNPSAFEFRSSPGELFKRSAA